MCVCVCVCVTPFSFLFYNAHLAKKFIQKPTPFPPHSTTLDRESIHTEPAKKIKIETHKKLPRPQKVTEIVKKVSENYEKVPQNCKNIPKSQKVYNIVQILP